MITDCMVLAPTDQSALVREPVRVIGKTRDGRVALFRLGRKKGRDFAAPYFVNASALEEEIRAKAVLLDQPFEIDWMPTSFAEVSEFRVAKNGVRSVNPAYQLLQENLRLMAPLIGGDALAPSGMLSPDNSDSSGSVKPASEASLLDPMERAILIRDLSSRRGKGARQIGRLLSLWWFGGKTTLALVPNFGKRGPKGQRQGAKQKKRGRKRGPRVTKTEHLRGVEVAVSPELRERIFQHVRTEWRPGKRGLRRCYDDYLARFHNKGYVARDSGLVEPMIDYSKAMPSFKQYRYVAESANLNGEMDRLALGERKYKDKVRILVKTGRGGVRGPAHIFQIDWTGVQLNIRSVFDKNVSVGQAIVYFIVDVWSTAIVGFYLVLAKTPTFAMARRALLHAFADKVVACAEHGVKIDDDEWLAHHLCHVLVADNGEIAGDVSDAMPEELRSREWFTRGKTPTDHALVERINGILKAGPLGEIPGAWRKKGSFREEDLRHAGITSIPATRKLIINAILKHNRASVPKDLIPPEYIEAGHIDTSRIRLHEWGLENLNSLARTCDPKVVYAALLTSGTAKVRRDGIHFKYEGRDCRYVDESPLLTSLMLKAARRDDFDIDIRFDEMAAHRILVKLDSGRGWQAVPCADKDIVERQASFTEAALLMKARAELTEATRAKNRGYQVAKTNQSQEIIRQEAELSGLADDGRSKTKRKRTDMRMREVEAALHRSQENIHLDKALGQELLSHPDEASASQQFPKAPSLREFRDAHAERVRKLSNETT